MKIPEEFINRIDISPSGCWNWTGALTGTEGKRYGFFRRNRQMVMAHRYFFELATGIKVGANEVHHLCYNTRCVNPAHLAVMTHAAHMKLHGIELQARNLEEQKTCANGHPWTEETTHIDRRGFRRCRECARQYAQRKLGNDPLARRGLKDFCKNGHPMSGDNLRIDPKSGRRQCVACRRETQQRAQQRFKEGTRKVKPTADKTHCKHGHEFTPENTYIASTGARACVECRREAVRRQRARKKE